MSKKIFTSLCCFVLLGFAATPRVSFADPLGTVTLELETNGVTPYGFDINGSTTQTILTCLNDNRTVFQYESWTATGVSLASLAKNDLPSTPVGGITVDQLELDAFLDMMYTSGPGSATNNQEVQDAIWSVLTGTLGNTTADHNTYNYTGLSGGQDTVVQNDISIALADVKATANTSPFYSDFTYYYPTSWGTRDSEPQQFLGYSTVTPEPSSLVLLGTGILGLAGAMRRRVVRNRG